MRISCVNVPTEIDMGGADLIVLPEYSELAVVCETASRYPRSIVVAAFQEGIRSRGLLFHGGENRIDYLKIGSDGRTKGARASCRRAVFSRSDICIGVVICMDVQDPGFLGPVTDTVRSSTSKLKFICIPADMDAVWFSGDILHDPKFEGVRVILCNHLTNHQSRCKSFMADTNRTKIIKQLDVEPIHWELG